MATSLAAPQSSTVAGAAALRQRVVTAKSTIHNHNESDASSSSDESGDEMNTFTPPSFTVKDLLGAIPKHCFERSALRSFSYLICDFIMLSIIVYTATFIDGLFNFKSGSLLDGYAGSAARVAAWSLYAFAAGSVGTGVWVIAHECGHQAFSTSKTLNNAVGWVCHSALLVPYHSWRISHARHHAATGSMERDEVFVPKTRSQVFKGQEQAKAAAAAVEDKQGESTFEALDEILEDAPLWNLFWVTMQQLLGWPMYLIRNASGQKYGRWTNHFDPHSPIFDKRHFWQIIASDIGILTTMAALATWSHYRSFGEVVRYYLIPYLVVNHHLVLITFLQHTDPNLVHYREGEWTFPRGALCTIDRNLGGALGAFILHGICETHVSHHVCSRIPHYHAWEATEALKGVLGEHYQKSDDNMYTSLLNNYRDCKFVEDEGQILVYKNKSGKSKTKVVCDADSGVDINGSASAAASGSEEDY